MGRKRHGSMKINDNTPDYTSVFQILYTAFHLILRFQENNSPAPSQMIRCLANLHAVLASSPYILNEICNVSICLQLLSKSKFLYPFTSRHHYLLANWSFTHSIHILFRHLHELLTTFTTDIFTNIFLHFSRSKTRMISRPGCSTGSINTS